MVTNLGRLRDLMGSAAVYDNPLRVLLWTAGKRDSECHGHGNYQDVLAIRLLGPWGAEGMPPVFLSRKDAESWISGRRETLEVVPLWLQLEPGVIPEDSLPQEPQVEVPAQAVPARDTGNSMVRDFLHTEDVRASRAAARLAHPGKGDSDGE